MKNMTIAQNMNCRTRTKTGGPLLLLTGILLLGQAGKAVACPERQTTIEKQYAPAGPVRGENPVPGSGYYQSTDNPFYAD